MKNRTIFTHDNLPVLRGMDCDTVDLVYLDPPFNSKREYHGALNTEAEGTSFDDVWHWSRLDESDAQELAVLHEDVASLVRTAEAVHGKGMASYLVFMGLRLIELRRVLKPTGSIYLHCDDTAGAYLGVLMDAVFGRAWFKNAITWRRTKGRSDAKRSGRCSDYLLYYAGEGAVWNTQWLDLDPEYIKRSYRNEDERGRWQAGDLTAGGPSRGESGKPWRGVDPGSRHWSTPTKGAMSAFIAEHVPGWPDAFSTVHARLDALDEHGFVHWPQGGMPRLKRYLAASRGTAVPDIWTDIGKLESASKEKTGYATQKPLALLRRVIEASSTEGDLVLDPFCGCATTCVAAEELGRRWVGIDELEDAATMVLMRLEQQQDELPLWKGKIHHRKRPPARTDRDPEVPGPKLKAFLVQRDGERCAYCTRQMDAEFLECDHVVPRRRGGPNHQDNRKLACRKCNNRKGTKSEIEYLRELEAERLQASLGLGENR